MYQEISRGQFIDAFNDMGRKDQFSYNALCALYDYLNQLEDETDTKIPLDVIALCCDFNEYDDLADLQAEYTDIKSRADLENHTTVIDCKDGHIIVQVF